MGNETEPTVDVDLYSKFLISKKANHNLKWKDFEKTFGGGGRYGIAERNTTGIEEGRATSFEADTSGHAALRPTDNQVKTRPGQKGERVVYSTKIGWENNR